MNMTFDTWFLIVWLAWSALMITGLTPFVIWAIKHRQFSNQDHARHLALTSYVPDVGPISQSDRGASTSEETPHAEP